MIEKKSLLQIKQTIVMYPNEEFFDQIFRILSSKQM